MSSLLQRRRRSRSRGATAIEFALTLPVLVALLTTTMDYGWYFLQEYQFATALGKAARSGSFETPGPTDGPGECSSCVTRTAQIAAADLSAIGISVSPLQVTPSIQAIEGTCALVLQPVVPYVAIVGLVPVPDSFGVRIVAYAQNVKGC